MEKKSDNENRYVYIGITCAYFIIGIYLVFLSKDQINPDGISYMQNARHYAAGRFSLAINSYFGPLLSWLLVPAVFLNVDLQLAFKVLNLLLGLLFSYGSLRLWQEVKTKLEINWSGLPTYIIAIILALNMIPEVMSPDMLLATILTWYFVFSLQLIYRTSTLCSVTAGILAGLGYFAKAYCFPFVVVHGFIMLALRRIAIIRGCVLGPVFTPIILAGVSFFFVTLPWITIISVNDGKLTIGSSGKITYFSTLEINRLGDMFSVQQLHQPKEGRVTSWENPMEIPEQFFSFDAAEGVQNSIKFKISTITRNGILAILALKSLDNLGLLVISYGSCFFLLFFSGSRAQLEKIVIFWVFITVLLYTAGYIIVRVEQRYLWPVQPLLIVMTIYIFQRIYLLFHKDDSSQRCFVRIKSSIFIFFVSTLLLISTGWKTREIIKRWEGKQGFSWISKWLRHSAGIMLVEGKIVSNRWYEGLYFSFWQNNQFVGVFTGKTPQAVLEELAQFEGNVWVVIYYDAELARSLLSHPFFTLSGISSKEEPFMVILKVKRFN